MGEDVTWPYRWAWTKLPGRKGTLCRVICRGTMNSALLEFQDGYRVITSRNGLRRATTAPGVDRMR